MRTWMARAQRSSQAEGHRELEGARVKLTAFLLKM